MTSGWMRTTIIRGTVVIGFAALFSGGSVVAQNGGKQAPARWIGAAASFQRCHRGRRSNGRCRDRGRRAVQHGRSRVSGRRLTRTILNTCSGRS